VEHVVTMRKSFKMSESIYYSLEYDRGRTNGMFLET
jgi:hypothetical protein